MKYGASMDKDLDPSKVVHLGYFLFNQLSVEMAMSSFEFDEKKFKEAIVSYMKTKQQIMRRNGITCNVKEDILKALRYTIDIVNN
jgi:hypothetical protein